VKKQIALVLAIIMCTSIVSAFSIIDYSFLPSGGVVVTGKAVGGQAPPTISNGGGSHADIAAGAASTARNALNNAKKALADGDVDKAEGWLAVAVGHLGGAYHRLQMHGDETEDTDLQDSMDEVLIDWHDLADIMTSIWNLTGNARIPLMNQLIALLQMHLNYLDGVITQTQTISIQPTDTTPWYPDDAYPLQEPKGGYDIEDVTGEPAYPALPRDTLTGGRGDDILISPLDPSPYDISVPIPTGYYPFEPGPILTGPSDGFGDIVYMSRNDLQTLIETAVADAVGVVLQQIMEHRLETRFALGGDISADTAPYRAGATYGATYGQQYTRAPQGGGTTALTYPYYTIG